MRVLLWTILTFAVFSIYYVSAPKTASAYTASCYTTAPYCPYYVDNSSCRNNLCTDTGNRKFRFDRDFGCYPVGAECENDATCSKQTGYECCFAMGTEKFRSDLQATSCYETQFALIAPCLAVEVPTAISCFWDVAGSAPTPTPSKLTH